ncbi:MULTISPECIES: CHAT domain-containing protein [unclassified Myxococcus]|uniref:CHAT domain-containing protein n=1 Tax=unclassified Myxococcus TaxID=2648731 RepID=UPI00157B51E3|nr:MULTISPECIES: CHAT domain-containing protein [unclassified Myxococcus]NTX33994.1 CHAT domain-containing protein [Myxococcus sp. CA033]NTX54911.1 CHAT domain-containing protein [Myxococcus sp. CA039A]
MVRHFLSGRYVPASEVRYRATEARLSGSGAETYKPLVPAMAGATEAGQLAPESMGVSVLTDGKDPVASALMQGDRNGAELALTLLREFPQTPDTESRRAMALLRLGKPEDALQRADAALAAAPRHAEALWNRGLALRDLRLPLAAARTFTQVASLKEPGWADEATQRAEGLQRDVFTHRNRWTAVFKAGTALIANADVTLPEDFSDTPIARLFFYDAVRAAPTSEAVLTLLPLARKLDERTLSHVLEAYVQRVAAADFTQRGPLARGYAALVLERPSALKKEHWMMQILSSQEDDLLLGALLRTDTVAGHLELFQAKANAMKDPWFQLLAAQERAAMDKRAGRLAHAVGTLREVLPLCERPGLEYRCLSIESEVSTLLIKLHEFQDARQHAEKAWREARATNEWQLEQDLLWNLGQIARLVKDTSLSRAYLEEFLERNERRPDAVRRVHENLASIAFQGLRVDEARQEIDAALASGLPLSPSGAFTLSEIARVKGAPGDDAHLLKALTNPSVRRSPGERAVGTHTLGRFFIERDLARGRELLWRSIQEAAAPGLEEDLAASRARAYSFTSLIFETGRRGSFKEALELFSQERGLQLPGRCLLVATADSERTLLIVRGEDGKLLSSHDETRREPLPERLDGLVPEELLAALRPCERVEVFARPPLHGRAGLLPLSMAWSYLTRTSTPRVPRTGPSVHLIVSDVEVPPGADVLPLPHWVPSFGPDEQHIMRSGADATPSRVRSAMRDATEIDLVTHGFIYERADASYLLLSPERGARELTVPQVRETRLRGAPFVVLSSCHAAHTSYALHEPLSLPAAFIHAGARGVLAATARIPGHEANVFFNQVRDRMRMGVPPAVALRDVRAQWLGKDAKQEWLASVLLFE